MLLASNAAAVARVLSAGGNHVTDSSDGVTITSGSGGNSRYRQEGSTLQVVGEGGDPPMGVVVDTLVAPLQQL